MTSDERARALRAAANKPLKPAAAPAMGIRYTTTTTPPAAPPDRTAGPARRPGWATALAATPTEALEQLSPTSRTHQVPTTRPRTNTAAAALAAPAKRPVPAPRQPAECEAGRGWDSIEAAAAAAGDLLTRAAHLSDPEQAADLREQAAEMAGALVLRRQDVYACLRCGSRYRYDVTDHDCGPLTPVTVTITARTSTPDTAAVLLGSYDTFGCWTCRITAGSGDADHGCGPLTPVTVTITRRCGGGR